MADDADRTIPATPRRREAARRSGAMPPATLPAWAATATTAILLLPAWGRSTLPAAVEVLRQTIPAAARPGGEMTPLPVMPLLVPTVGLVLASAAAGLCVRFAMDGVGWHPGRLAPDLRRLDPFAGLARIVAPGTLAAVLGNLAALAAVAATVAAAAGPLAAVVSGDGGPGDPVAAWAAACGLLPWAVAPAAGIAVVQWALGRRRFERRLRMTPQEFADETRGLRADPRVRLLHRAPTRRAQPPSAAAGR